MISVEELDHVGNVEPYESDIKLSDIENMSDEELKNLTMDDHIALEKQRNDITKKATQKTTAQDLRTQILDHSLAMIQELQESFHNDKQLTMN